MYSVICLFCCKGIEPESSEESFQTKKKLLTKNRFLKCIKRCFRPLSHTAISSSASYLFSAEQNNVDLCDDCFLLVESICDQFHDVKCMELKLQWRFQTLRNIMEAASKIKSRMHLLKMTLETCQDDRRGAMSDEAVKCGELYKHVKKFRKEFLKNCTELQFVGSSPRVVLQRRFEDVAKPEGKEKDNHSKNVTNDRVPSESIVSQEELLKKFVYYNLSFLLVLFLSDEILTVPQSCSTCSLKSKQLEAEDIACSGTSVTTTNVIVQPNSSSCDNNTERPDFILLTMEEEEPQQNHVLIHKIKDPDPKDDYEDTSMCYDDQSSISNDHDDVVTNQTETTTNHPPSSMSEAEISTSENLDLTEKATSDADAATLIHLKVEEINGSTGENFAVEGKEGNNCLEGNNCEISIKEESIERTKTRYNLRTARLSNKVYVQDEVNSDNDNYNVSDDDSNSFNKKEKEDSSFSSETSDNETDQDFSTDKFQCKFCLRTFITEARLNTHLKKKICFNSNDKKKVKSLTATASPDTRTRRKIKKVIKADDDVPKITDSGYYVCMKKGCKEYLKDIDDYNYHKKLHGIFSCSFCDESFGFAPDLSFHETVHSERQEGKANDMYYCARCPYQVIRKARLMYVKHHLEQHLNITQKCPICKASVSPELKNRHYATHHDTTGVDPDSIKKCREESCQAYFLTRRQLHLHMLEIHESAPSEPSADQKECIPAEKSPNQSQFKCQFCKKKFRIRSWLVNHLKNFHKRNLGQKILKKRKILKCTVANCKEYFRAKEALEEHSKLHGTFKCNFCEVEKDYAPDIALHEVTEHSRIAIQYSQNESPNNSDIKVPSSSKPPPRKFSCSRCEYSSAFKTWCTKHFLEKHLNLSTKSAYCEVCGVLLSKQNEVPHFSSHHNIEGVDPKDIYRCDKCPAFFLLGIQLLSHNNKVHGMGSKCIHCGLLLKDRKSLRNHLVSKHKDIDDSHLPIPCEVPNCGKRFATKANLEWHTTYEHLYSEKDSGIQYCTICNKGCESERGLQVHMIVHTKPKKKKMPFICEHCGKEFKMKCLLEQHAIFHTDPSTWKFKCSICSKMCVDKYRLQWHMQVHSKEKPFVCDICGQKYAHRHNFRHHVKNVHGIEIPKMRGKSHKESVNEKNN